MARIVGVDVSKGQLDAYDLGAGRRISVANDAAGIGRLAAWVSPQALVVMEASNGYERLAHRRSGEHGRPVAIVNAKRVRDFATASGRLAKTDRVDAEVIAPVRRVCPATGDAGAAAAAAARKLAELLAFRQRLVSEITARQQQLAHLETPPLRRRARRWRTGRRGRWVPEASSAAWFHEPSPRAGSRAGSPAATIKLLVWSSSSFGNRPRPA